MRGPSSSHCAAAVRIGRLARDLMGGRIEHVRMEFDAKGSLAFTHEGQGSDMGLFGGLLGWDAPDERLADSSAAIQAAGIQVELRIADFGDAHPNTYRLTLNNAHESRGMIALSTGGGMIEVIDIDGFPLSLKGDYFETLIYANSQTRDIIDLLKQHAAADDIALRGRAGNSLIQVKTQAPIPQGLLSEISSRPGVTDIRTLGPVLPVLACKSMRVPFSTCAEMTAFNEAAHLDLGRLAACYESARGNIREGEVVARMAEIVRILRRSIARGLQGTHVANRILGPQSGGFQAARQGGRLLDAGMLNTMILYVSALMEVKSAMGVIVAAPTAGSCGGLPGAVFGAAEHMELSEDHMVQAMLAAGMIGVFICARSTFAAEVCGCMAECGSGSGMAAAALVTLAGGSARQAVDAASMALQNTLGMICDPVANRVEVPCLGKNVLAASNALACANMALAGYDAVIPLDETIAAMDRIGKGLPMELRCTNLGGLSITAAAKALEKRLASGILQD
ncbi:MAG: L-serine ammonia-lyase, iron-sulfur-dependent, subunit alpha [Deltaproteobacteria bacterium]|nr:L-serine ammonia-lyase, iron-sulfur-dependent, subunit alpha [Deltaproteobacteria bacterium]